MKDEEVNISDYQPKPLSIGDILSLSIHLYLTNFKIYFKEILVACLWLIVPILGWGKFLVSYGLISRLIFQELIGQPETIKTARKYVNRRLGSFLFLAVFVTFVTFAIVIISLLITAMAIVAIRLDRWMYQLDTPLEDDSFFAVIFLLIVLLSLLLLMFLGMFGPGLYFLGRFLLADVSLAIEDKINTFQSLSLSLQLTKGYFGSLFVLFLLINIILLPFIMAGYLANYLAGLAISELPLEIKIPTNYLEIIYLVIGLLLLSAFYLFIQICKTLIYYNLCIRRQGLGLEIIREDKLLN